MFRDALQVIVLASLAVCLGACSSAPELLPLSSYDATTDPTGFYRVLLRDEASGLVTRDRIHELDRQRTIFDERRAELTADLGGKTVAVCRGEVFVGESPREVLAEIDRKHPGAPVYMESSEDWIYHYGLEQRPLAKEATGWLAGPDFEPGFVDLTRQKELLEHAVGARTEELPPWCTYQNGQLYGGEHRMDLVQKVAADGDSALLLYCWSKGSRRWDAIPTRAVCGDAFFDHRGLLSTMIEVGSRTPSDATEKRLLKVDVGSATPITTFDHADLSGMDVGYRGVLVANTTMGGRWAAGVLSGLKLRLRLGDRGEQTWDPPVVLTTRRSITGVDMMMDLQMFPDIAFQSALPPLGVRRIGWTKWEQPAEGE